MTKSHRRTGYRSTRSFATKMTSRLKRKLGELGIDTSSRKANENFCLIGTPLPPLEKSKDTGEFVPLWKQEVRDEKGRRRLHGAFTGGWSAGYFNTVGSKEGWSPSTFVSSRTDRAKKQAARPEDFMDEEDLQIIKDNRNIVDTTEEMDILGGTQAELRSRANDVDTEVDPITLTLQSTLLLPPKSSIGAKILQKMGWRAGQGIGPRVSLARRRAQDAQAYDPFTGTRVTNGSLEIPEEDEEAKKHSYAPRDVPVLSVQRKDNSHGLGYVPGTSLHSTLGASSSSSQHASGPRLAGGFGLGALNDADDDDLDVYESIQRPPASRRHVAYDHMEGVDDDDTVVIGGSSGKGKGKAEASKSKGSSHTIKAGSHFRDGRAILQGFVLSDEPVAQDKWFPLPDIPPSWKPNPRSVWDANKENRNVPLVSVHTQGPAQSHEKWRSSQLSADQRGLLLEETPLPSGPTKSVFQYMSEKDRERIQRIASTLSSGKTTSILPGSAPSTQSSFSTTMTTTAPLPPTHLEPHVAQAALQGFQPFTADSVKQSRYTSFLQSIASGSTTTSSLEPLPDQTNEEFNKELSDFSKAAALFKPMSGAMQGRFMSASVLDMGSQVIEGLHHPSSQAKEEEEAKRQKEAEEKVDPKVNAAKMGMYGPLTREVRPWVPAKLLCKRFGVREPDVNLDSMAEVAKADQPSELSVLPSSTLSATDVGTSVDAGTGGGPRDITNLGLGEDETQGRDILTYERPPIDVFKAIFASDDEDEAEEEGDEGEKEEEKKAGFTNAMVVLQDDDNDEPVNLETFKPKFVPRPRDKEKDKEKRKGEKKDKKKGKGKVLVSFEMEEVRPTKKRRKGEDLQYETAQVEPSTDPETVRGRKRAVDFMD